MPKDDSFFEKDKSSQILRAPAAGGFTSRTPQCFTSVI